ncbi:hypothetical protein ABN028_07495 [Actinopolymorpha sp. B17G11]|uniref:hypothetical protein n=1 Tax=Actinopolymorpha sp. B17G11 TaxID=3160861 RepID=UPI0032E45658
MAESSGQYVAFDHTDLERRRKKLWNLADGVPLTLIGGIDLRALVVAGVLFLALLGGVMALAPVVPVLAFDVWSILGSLSIAALVYVLWPRRWRNGLTTEQNLLVAADYLFLQPRRIHGLAEDVEPDVVHWRVILWHPLHPRWYGKLAEARRARWSRLIRPYASAGDGAGDVDGAGDLAAAGSRTAAGGHGSAADRTDGRTLA